MYNYGMSPGVASPSCMPGGPRPVDGNDGPAFTQGDSYA